MALLMRRLFVDAQAKLRRMVEEHTANLTSRIEPECPSVADPPAASSPTPTSINPVPSTAAAAASAAVCSSPRAVPSLGARSLSLTSAQASEDSDHHRESLASSFDVKCLASFSQCKVNSSFDGGGTDDLCKTSKTDNSDKSGGVVVLDGGADMTCAEVERSASSPGKDASNSNKTSPSRSESPKPGCSQDKSEEVQLKAELPENSRLKNVTLITTSTTSSSTAAAALRRMRLENERLQAEVTRLRRLVVSGASSKLNSHNDSSCDGDSESGPVDCSPAQVQALEAEIKLAREAVATLKADRKRLKAEKFDLLSQMKQLYATLDDKEKELREFIRNYEQRMRDSETSMQQLAAEREERERERWSLLRHARDEAERSLSLAAQLNAKELQLQQALEQLHEARRQLSSNGCLSDQESLASLPRYSSGGGGGGAATPGSGTLLPHGLGLLAGDRGSCSADSGVRVSSDRDSGGATSAGGNLSDSTTDGTPTITVDGNNIDVDSISVVSSIVPHMYHPMGSTKDCSPTLSPLNANVFSRSIDSGVLSRSVEQLSSPMDSEPTSVVSRRMKAFHSRPGSSRGGTWGSISRVFARSRHRNKVTNPSQDNEPYDPYRSWSPLTEEGYAEKLRLLREASAIPMEKWRAPTVLAWIEIALGMPQYGARCAENIKSGKIHGLHGQVLLELSDLELECGLGITHPMHRKKLRLAIEEHRHPSLVRYPCISQLGHTWVSSEWLPDLGLAQYSENFAANMVDARMLDHLSKKELEKFLGVTRKFHQASIVHGIHLLRIMKYDRQALAVRRHQSENVDADPLVWTNQRFIRWARNIDLGEYADNLKDSGVHGGLVVLEPSFNGDTMATALGIPPSKNMIRRHLMAELEALVLPARSTLEHYIRVRGAGAKHRVPGGSLGRSFSRSCGGSLAAPLPPTSASKNSSESDSRRSSLRGSLGRALGFVKSDRSDKQSPTSSSESSSIISRMSTPPPLHMRESPIYAKPFAFHHSVSTSKQDEALYEDVLSDTAQSTSSAMLRKYEDRNDSSMGFHRRVKSIGEGDVVVSPV